MLSNSLNVRIADHHVHAERPVLGVCRIRNLVFEYLFFKNYLFMLRQVFLDVKDNMLVPIQKVNFVSRRAKLSGSLKAFR